MTKVLGWHQIAAVEVRGKGATGEQGYDSKVRSFGGSNTRLIGAVQCNFAAHTFRAWFQDVGWQKIKWPDWLNITDFDVQVRDTDRGPRLVIWVTEWNKDSTLHLVDTGWVYELHDRP